MACSFLMEAGRAAEWRDVIGSDEAPRLLVLSSRKASPVSLPFIPERAKAGGLWQSYGDARIIAKIGETMTRSNDALWEDSGMWAHFLASDGKWVDLPVYQTANSMQGAVRTGDAYFAMHPALWKNLQATRPASSAGNTPDAGEKAKTGKFTVNLGEMEGKQMTPDDRKANPFLNYKGEASSEEAQVEVPAGYDGSKPYGLMVFISPRVGGDNGLNAGWRKDFDARDLIWIGAKNSGNNHPGDRRVWLAQQARAWALHHYLIDPQRMIISGFSNGADAASATAVATPFGFNNAILFAPPCSPPVGVVPVPQEKDAKGSPVVMVKPLSSGGLSHIKREWRIAYVVGTKDKFLSNVRQSAAAVNGFDAGSKLFEIDALGHGVPGDIGNILEFIFSPRSTSGGRSGGLSFNPDPVLVEIGAARTSNPARARELMTQLWNNHPDTRANPAVSEMLENLERLP